MKPAFSFDEIREAEKNIIEKENVPSLVLMENAGKNSFQILFEEFGDLNDRNIFIVCGKGNNAGDGFVIGEHPATARIVAAKAEIVHGAAGRCGEAIGSGFR